MELPSWLIGLDAHTAKDYMSGAGLSYTSSCGNADRLPVKGFKRFAIAAVF
jgi:hypothetical protein